MSALTLEDIKKNKDIWDDRYNLPLYPNANNPFIYMAYGFQLMKDAGIETPPLSDVVEHYAKCETRDRLINRWPDGTGGVTSFDELIGAASLTNVLAVAISESVSSRWGYYNNLQPKPISIYNFFRYNMFRFIDFAPYLRACTQDEIVYPWHIVLWSINCFVDSFGSDSGGHLKIWLMSRKLNKYLLCRIAITIRKIILKYRLQTLKNAISDELPLANEYITIAKEY